MNNEHLIGPVKYKNKYGYINPEGEFVIEPKYAAIGGFREGVACFRQNGKYGFIDTKGAVVIKPCYESARSDGPSFRSGYASVSVNNKIGYIDKLGEVKIQFQYDQGLDFLCDHAIAGSMAGKTNYFIINKMGEMVASLNVYEVPDVDMWPMRWDLFACYVMVENRLLVEWLDIQGRVQFPARYPWMTDFCGEISGFCEHEDNSEYPFGFVNRIGDIIVSPRFYGLSSFSQGLARAGNKKRNYGYIDITGEYVITPRYCQASPFQDGLACVSRDKKNGYINLNGEMVIEPRYDHQESFSEGFARVEYEGKYAVIDKLGRVIWETEIN